MTTDQDVTVIRYADAENPAGSECWVVESHRQPTIMYWTGYFFHKNFEQAVRLCRKQDAVAVRSVFSEAKEYVCVRYLWL